MITQTTWLTGYAGAAVLAAAEVPDATWLPPQLFNGVGILTLLVISWWLLVRGTLHTDSEFKFVLAQLTAKDAQLVAKDAQLAAKDDTLNEVLSQNRTLIESNRQTLHVLEGFKAAAEAKP